MKKKILCFLGFHRWHKYRFPDGARVQSYGQRVCEWCGAFGLGYARRNHPFFRQALGEYSE